MPSTLLDNDTREVAVGLWGLPGILTVPRKASALIVFAHGSGSSRFSMRNRLVARVLNQAGWATLLFDLLRPEEEAVPGRARVFDIPFLATRLVDAVEWGDEAMGAATMPIGLFGASTGAAAALMAAAELNDRIGAVVSRGGRPDLAGHSLEKVTAPTLLIVGGEDHGVMELNQYALEHLKGVAELKVVPGATHLFPEAGAMEKVTTLATHWFERYLASSHSQGSHAL